MSKLYINFGASGDTDDNDWDFTKSRQEALARTADKGLSAASGLRVCRCGTRETTRGEFKTSASKHGVWECERCSGKFDEYDTIYYITPTEVQDNVMYLNLKGCNHEAMGGSPDEKKFRYYFADIHVSITITMKLFDKNGMIMYTNTGVKEIFGEGVRFMSGFNKLGSRARPNLIVLTGYSKGAVQCFYLAMALKAYEPTSNIPVYICAEQPVPGFISGLNAMKFAWEFRKMKLCDNIRHISVLLADTDLKGLPVLDKIGFRQMVPPVGPKTRRTVLFLPTNIHLSKAGYRDLYRWHIRDFLYRELPTFCNADLLKSLPGGITLQDATLGLMKPNTRKDEDSLIPLLAAFPFRYTKASSRQDIWGWNWDKDKKIELIDQLQNVMYYNKLVPKIQEYYRTATGKQIRLNNWKNKKAGICPMCIDKTKDTKKNFHFCAICGLCNLCGFHSSNSPLLDNRYVCKDCIAKWVIEPDISDVDNWLKIKHRVWIELDYNSLNRQNEIDEEKWNLKENAGRYLPYQALKPGDSADPGYV